MNQDMIKQHNVIDGMNYLLRGISMLTRPGLRRYVALPLLINIILFSVLLRLSGHYFGELTQWIDGFLPQWLHWLNWILWVVFVFSFLIVMAFTFNIIANIIGAPFNGLLSEKVEMMLTGKPPEFEMGWVGILKDVPRVLKRQGRYLLYYIPRAIVLLLLFIIPVVQVVAAPLWFLFGAWSMSIQYMDYPMDNHRVPFKAMLQQLKQRFGVSFGFGAAVTLMTLIPIVNFIVMPAAVVGATIYWVEQWPSKT